MVLPAAVLNGFGFPVNGSLILVGGHSRSRRLGLPIGTRHATSACWKRSSPSQNPHAETPGVLVRAPGVSAPFCLGHADQGMDHVLTLVKDFMASTTPSL